MNVNLDLDNNIIAKLQWIWQQWCYIISYGSYGVLQGTDWWPRFSLHPSDIVLRERRGTACRITNIGENIAVWCLVSSDGSFVHSYVIIIVFNYVNWLHTGRWTCIGAIFTLWTTRRQTKSPTDQLADKPTRRQTNSPTIKLSPKSM